MPPSFLTSRPYLRVLSVARFKLVAIFLLVSTVLLFTSYSWGSIKTIASEKLRLDDDDNSPDYWAWDTRIQVTLKVGATESAARINASMDGVTACIDNLFVVADQATELHGHQVHDVLADIAPFAKEINATDFQLYEALQRGDSNIGGEAGWKLDRFKFLPMIEQAKKKNPVAEWFVFLETDTYFVWDNVFRLLDQFDPYAPHYFGSPSPGFKLDGGNRVWFAYGGAGFILSRGAMEMLTDRKIGKYGEYIDPSLSEKYMEVVNQDCCGDSVLGFALWEAGVKLSGLWPMFNAHSLHGIPFDHVHWCQPVISLHKSLLSDVTGLAKWEAQRSKKNPLLYSEIIDYLQLGHLEDRNEWDNGDFSGFIEPAQSPAHESLAACRKACHEHKECFSFTYDSKKTCVFVRTIRLGQAKKLGDGSLTAGWDNEKILAWRESHHCEAPLWVKPSISRIF
ncbi:hypothetical protein N7468_002652 [Penicillium chermesinum]|uniref:N-acetylgalactosaminide beta-1,3-galactosyltransferase n=1 Tax=Penicillium chermesinum TaxID=63820 RepID=A0A9W9PIW7_9EURO|nr:uncharacterized protein N7468_002652 [Penicillium chermesinum]KAJ5247669.1 hypothetical protein N7468_002652 [Penicillium chermesinum]